MCRWVAHAGPEIYLEDLIFHQEHSIVSQSLAATQSAWATNGDGFGVAWYNQRTVPGLFKDVLPAWNDANLRSIAAHNKTNLFFAHVRATTGTAVNRSNCHPFTWQNWTFMHNGKKLVIGRTAEKTWKISLTMFTTHTEKAPQTVKPCF
jgi:predicted glutamine amidotransferase